MASKRLLNGYHGNTAPATSWNRFFFFLLLAAGFVSLALYTTLRRQTATEEGDVSSLSSPSSSSSLQLSPTHHISSSTKLPFISTLYSPRDIPHLRWGIIFDAGSTGSRVHVYRFRVGDSIESAAAASPTLEDEIFVEVKPGLSAYIPSGVGSDVASGTRDVGAAKGELKQGPKAAAESLRVLMELCREQIPKEAHANTPISLRATAGLRLLGTEVSESILSEIRNLFSEYPFPYDAQTDVEVMNGSEEGVFAWITVNYLTKQLSEEGESSSSATSSSSAATSSYPSTSAILDLGGASTQIVFEPSSSLLSSLPPALSSHANLYHLPWGSRRYTLFETSYLGYGLMEARRRVKEVIVKHKALAIRPIVFEEEEKKKGVKKGDKAESQDNIFYHPCFSSTYEATLPTGELIRGYTQGHASCAVVVRTLFEKHATSASAGAAASSSSTSDSSSDHCTTSPYCSFNGYFSLPLSQHASLQTSQQQQQQQQLVEQATHAEEHVIKEGLVDYSHSHSSSSPSSPRGRIYAFSYFYDRTLDIFDLEEEYTSPHTQHQEATQDGTVLRLARIRELADRVCAFDMRVGEMRSVEEIEKEKEKEVERQIQEMGKRGCKRVKVKKENGGKEEWRDVEVNVGDTTASSSTNIILDEGECQIEEKPDLTSSYEHSHSSISSPLVALLTENPSLCFDLTYAHTLLHYGYDLSEETELHIMKKLQKKEIGWCLGAMLNQMTKRGW